jgi:cytochrome c55X
MPRRRHNQAFVYGCLTMMSMLVAPVQAGDGAAHVALERLVRQDCGSCHGMTLKGGLGPDLRAPRLAGKSADAVAQIILDGVPGTAMPPWRPLLSEADALWIANYLLSETKE